MILGAECAIISNYLLNNVWTFGDRRIHGWKHLRKFGEFNAGSIGSVVIQYLDDAGVDFVVWLLLRC